MAKAATQDPHISCIQPEQPGSSPGRPASSKMHRIPNCGNFAGQVPLCQSLRTSQFYIASHDLLVQPVESQFLPHTAQNSCFAQRKYCHLPKTATGIHRAQDADVAIN